MHWADLALGKNRSLLASSLVEVDFEFPQPEHLERCIRTLPLYAVLIVMSDVSEHDVARISVTARFTRLPVILCGKLTTAFSRLVVLLSKSGNPAVVTDKYDDAEKIMVFANAQSPAREQFQFRAIIEPCVQLLPVEMGVALDRILGQLPARGVVARLAEESRLTVRRTGDHMRAAGFANAHAVFRAHRLIDAWAFARDSGYCRKDLACKTGYGRADALFRTLRHLGINGLSDLASRSGDEIVSLAASDALRC